MKKMVLAIAITLNVHIAFAAVQYPANQQQEKTKSSEALCPMHDAPSGSAGTTSTMNERGEKSMGFSQTATTHHFLLKPDGGVIQVLVNDPRDTTDRDNIRIHLAHIAHAFGEGDFDVPMFVHDTIPPGVPEMRRLREKINYSFEETPAGGRVVIATADKEALAAIHTFLRFQIAEHKTGDPPEVK